MRRAVLSLRAAAAAAFQMKSSHCAERDGGREKAGSASIPIFFRYLRAEFISWPMRPACRSFLSSLAVFPSRCFAMFGIAFLRAEGVGVRGCDAWLQLCG